MPEEVGVLERSLPPRDPIALLPTAVAAKGGGVPAPVVQPMRSRVWTWWRAGPGPIRPAFSPATSVLLAVTEFSIVVAGESISIAFWMAVHFVRNPADGIGVPRQGPHEDWARSSAPLRSLSRRTWLISRGSGEARRINSGAMRLFDLKSISALVETSGLWSVNFCGAVPSG